MTGRFNDCGDSGCGGRWFDETWDDDAEDPQDCDFDEEGEETPTVPCPSCGAEIPDFADRCPYCGDWVIQGGNTSPKRGVPWVVIVVLLVIALILSLVVCFAC